MISNIYYTSTRTYKHAQVYANTRVHVNAPRACEHAYVAKQRHAHINTPGIITQELKSRESTVHFADKRIPETNQVVYI